MSWKARLICGAVLIVLGVAFAVLPKDWIEDQLGFEPDGGNGLVELLLAVVPIAAGVALTISALALRRSPKRA